MNQVTSASLRYPLSVFNKNSTLKESTHFQFSIKTLLSNVVRDLAAPLLKNANGPGSMRWQIRIWLWHPYSHTCYTICQSHTCAPSIGIVIMPSTPTPPTLNVSYFFDFPNFCGFWFIFYVAISLRFFPFQPDGPKNFTAKNRHHQQPGLSMPAAAGVVDEKGSEYILAHTGPRELDGHPLGGCGSGFGLVPGYTTLSVRVRVNI